MIRGIRFLSFLALAVIPAGCGYRLGADAEPDFRTISIEAVRNDSFAPQLQAEIHRQIHDALVSERALHVVNDGGRARLRVTLTGYDRRVGAVNPRDTVLAASHVFSLSAKVSLVDRSTGRELMHDRRVTASLSAYSSGGVNRTETQTQALLTRELARKIRESVVDVW